MMKQRLEDGEEAPPVARSRLDLSRFRYNGPEVRRSTRLETRLSSSFLRSSPRHEYLTDRVKKPSSTSTSSRGSTSSPSPSKTASPARRRRTSGRYAPPSVYAHLSPLVDILEPGLLLVLVGLNPGVSTAETGHCYAHPSNRFWHLLHACGLTPDRRLSPTEDRSLPQLYSMGLTNIVARPTKDGGELSRAEMVDGAGVLEEKFRKWRPDAVCLVGKGIWQAVFTYKHKRQMRKDEFKWGWQDERENMGRVLTKNRDAKGEPWNGAPVFVATSTSGQAASLNFAEKKEVWRPLGEWVHSRRLERERGLADR